MCGNNAKSSELLRWHICSVSCRGGTSSDELVNCCGAGRLYRH